MKFSKAVVISALLAAGALVAWDHVAQAKEQKLCYDCQKDGNCDPGPNCCVEIRCTNGPWYCCLGGGGWK
jgi:hypothetical protein